MGHFSWVCFPKWKQTSSLNDPTMTRTSCLYSQTLVFLCPKSFISDHRTYPEYIVLMLLISPYVAPHIPVYVCIFRFRMQFGNLVWYVWIMFELFKQSCLGKGERGTSDDVVLKARPQYGYKRLSSCSNLLLYHVYYSWGLVCYFRPELFWFHPTTLFRTVSN